LTPTVQSGSLNSVFSVAARSPIADDVEIRGSLVDNGTPLPLEIQPGGGPDLPIAGEQPFSLECGQ